MGLSDSGGNHVPNSNCSWHWYLVWYLVKACRKCKSKNTVPILYGLIDDFGQDEDEGDYELGGCGVTDNDPDYSCKDCGHKWMAQ